MKKVFFATTAFALALTIGSAFAADLPHYKAPPPPPPPPPPLWTGFYVGLNAGGTWANSNNVNVGTFPIWFDPGPVFAGGQAGGLASAVAGTGILGGQNNGGFIGGGQIGYNWQFYNAFLAGIEADIQGIASSGRGISTAFTGSPIPGFPANSVTGIIGASRSIDYIGTVRGRLGWLFTPTLLVYGTGGLAYGGVNSNTSLVQNINGPSAGITTALFSAGSFSDTRVGWTAGGGVEWMFWPNWSAKVEYLYYDLGTVRYTNGVLASFETAAGGNPPFFANASQTSVRFNGNIVRAGINYHFNWGAPPIVAKY